jgi:hypothetical protein
MLCAGVALAEIDETEAPKRLYSERRQVVLRLERLWALANVLDALGRFEDRHEVGRRHRQNARGTRHSLPGDPVIA